MTRYVVMARWWNGHSFDVTRKDCKTKNEAIGAISLLIREITPYQISYTDLKERDEIVELLEAQQRTIDDFPRVNDVPSAKRRWRIA